jgi:hypothetical protein
MADINTAMLYVLTNEDETLHYNLFSAPFMAHFGEPQLMIVQQFHSSAISSDAKQPNCERLQFSVDWP